MCAGPPVQRVQGDTAIQNFGLLLTATDLLKYWMLWMPDVNCTRDVVLAVVFCWLVMLPSGPEGAVSWVAGRGGGGGVAMIVMVTLHVWSSTLGYHDQLKCRQHTQTATVSHDSVPHEQRHSIQNHSSTREGCGILDLMPHLWKPAAAAALATASAAAASVETMHSSA
jgi:hypothetical protein